MPSPADATYAWAATVVDELVHAGVRDVAVCPGSRSAPLALCVAERRELRVLRVVDERSAAFLALGLASGSGRPAAMVCTSGTAGANAYPAVIEAAMSRVPLVVVTANRPPELHGFGALQTIPQDALFGAFATSVDVPTTEAGGPHLRALLSRALATATAERTVLHLDVPLREPLAPGPGPLPAPLGEHRPHVVTARSALNVDAARDLLRSARRPLIVAGPRRPDGAFSAAVAELSRALDAPVLAEAASGTRFTPHADRAVAHYEAMFRVPALQDSLRPDVILRVGGPLTTRRLQAFVDGCGARVVNVADPGRVCDPGHSAVLTLETEPVAALLELRTGMMTRAADAAWSARWYGLDRAASSAVAAACTGLADEPALAHRLVAALPPGSTLFLSNSMPIRDVDAFASRRNADVAVHVSRGASGIDGIVSTAFGVAAGGARRTVLLTGDTAFFHDVGGLAWCARLGIPLCIVVVNNAGGRIFEFLPVADATSRLEEMFVMPHGMDVAHAAQLAGATLHRPGTPAELDRALCAGMEGGVHVVEVRVEPSTVKTDHERAHAHVVRALEGWSP